MGDKSRITWTDATWNPTTGCTRVSRGCDHCYAFTLHNKRYRANVIRSVSDLPPRRYTGSGELVTQRARRGSSALPYPPQYDLPFSRVQLFPDRLDQPLRWRKPRRIFVDSMADLFHEDVPDEYIDRVFAVMALATWHTFQVLTKRPERMLAYLRTAGVSIRIFGRLSDRTIVDKMSELTPWPLPNVWLGVSAEDQATADERIPLLLETPAAVRFVSAEPLLGPLHLSKWFCCDRADPGTHLHVDSIDWVIVGGESGRNYRPMDHAWARSIRDQCRAAGVAFFFKQASGVRPGLPSGDRDLDGCQEFPNAAM